MFSSEPRCIYHKNQLGEVICQLRFPEILSVEATIPAAFQEEIRQDFPVYSVRKEASAPKLAGTPGNFSVQNQPLTTNYQFVSENNNWKVNLTSKFISLSCAHYTCWEDFARKLDKPLAAFIKVYKPAYFDRIGLRYLNFISRNQLEMNSVQYHDLIQGPFLGILSDADADENTALQSGVDADVQLRGGCRVKIHSGTGMVKRNGVQDPEKKFIIDLDLYMPGRIPVNMSAGSLQTLHAQAYPLFRDAITDKLHNAMEPETL